MFLRKECCESLFSRHALVRSVFIVVPRSKASFGTTSCCMRKLLRINSARLSQDSGQWHGRARARYLRLDPGLGNKGAIQWSLPCNTCREVQSTTYVLHLVVVHFLLPKNQVIAMFYAKASSFTQWNISVKTTSCAKQNLPPKNIRVTICKMHWRLNEHCFAID